MTPRRILRVVGTVELITLVLMLANLATMRLPALPSTLGPLHGLAYTATLGRSTQRAGPARRALAGAVGSPGSGLASSEHLPTGGLGR